MDLQSSIFPIQYTDERLDVTSLIRKHAKLISDKIDENEINREKITVYDDLTIIYMALLLYNVKHISWSYEKEFRYFIPSNVMDMPYVKANPTYSIMMHHAMVFMVIKGFCYICSRLTPFCKEFSQEMFSMI